MSELLHSCQDLKETDFFKKSDIRIHFIGAGGVGMYSLMRLSDIFGFFVSGSDRHCGEYAKLLCGEGYPVFIGHKPENVSGANLAVYSLAVGKDNPELVYAREKGIKTMSRPEFFGWLMNLYKKRIGVSGTHGKTTTTAMLDAIFSYSNKNPTTVLGAVIRDCHSPLRIGEREYLIYEACEYRDAFLSFSPTASIFTNLEMDHVDYFKSKEQIKKSFAEAMNISGLNVINIDSPWLFEIIPNVKSRVVSYGEDKDAEYRISNVSSREGKYSFSIVRKCEKILNIALQIPGRFNIHNAAGAAVMALEHGIGASDIAEALSKFKAPPRRLEIIGNYNGSTVYYDYAHHPTEIEKTILTLREMTNEKITVIFKPHTYTRTEGLMDGFVKALSLADRVLLCDIDGIREEKIEGVSSEKLASLIGEMATRVEEKGIKEYLSGGVTVIMGAADLESVRKEIIN